MKERIISCIKKVVNVDVSIEENVDIKTYGIDSLLKVQLVIALEDEFSITFNDDDINQSNFENIATICALLETYNVQ